MWFALVAVVAVTVWAASGATGIGLVSELADLISRGFNARTREVIRLILHPDWAVFGATVDPFLETVAMAVLGTFIGCLLALVVAFGASDVTAGGRGRYAVTKWVMSLLRSVPDVLWALLFVSAVGSGTISGVLALVFFNVGVVAKLQSETIDAVDTGPLEAADAAGAGILQRARAAVFPQVLPNYLAYTLYAFELNVRASAVLGLVGAGGIGGAAERRPRAVRLRPREPHRGRDLRVRVRRRDALHLAAAEAGPMTATDTTGTRAVPADAPRPMPPSRWPLRLAFFVVLLIVAWAFATADLDLAKLLRAPSRIARLFGLMFLPPDVSYLGRAFTAMLESVQMAWLGTLLAAVLSLPLSLLAAKNVSGTLGSSAARQVLNAIRAFPELVLVVLLVTITGLGPVTGTIALGLHSIGTLGKLSSESVESIDTGPLEAVEAVGGTWLQKMRWGVLPQALPEIVAFWLYRFEINIRASAVLGVIGAGGIGSVLTNTLTYREFGAAGMTFVVVVAVTLLIDGVSSRIRHRIIAGAPSRVSVEARAVTAGEI